jgi:hypothetical protein
MKPRIAVGMVFEKTSSHLIRLLFISATNFVTDFVADLNSLSSPARSASISISNVSRTAAMEVPIQLGHTPYDI